MNILLLNIATSGWGGIESYADVLASILLNKGHNVIVSSRSDKPMILKSTGAIIKTSRIRIRNSADVVAIFKIIKLCFSRDVDLIIAHHGKDFWPATLAAGISRRRIMIIRHQTAKLKKTTCWLINRWVDKVVGVSNAVRDSLLKSGVSGDKILVMHNCISLNRFNPDRIDSSEIRAGLGISESDVVLGAVGKLHRGKGVYDLLYAFSSLAEKYPSLRLLFVGAGPERSNLESEAERLFVRDRVIFTGVRTDVERMYAAIDLFVLPSKCVEGFGMVLIEAMAFKKPVIGNAIGAIPEIISHGVNGILVPPGDVKALSGAIAEYFENRELFRNIALAGRKTAEAKFSDKVYGEKFEDLLSTLK